MFAATITLTINAVAKVLNRVNQDAYGSEYSLLSATESINMKIRHSADSPDADGMKLRRHNVFVEHLVYATPTTLAKKATYTATIRCEYATDPTMSSDLGKAVNVWLGTGTNMADLSVGVN